jgi:hypothetical protein
VAYAGAAGTLIDLDHFLLARINTGDWRALRAIVREPSLAVLHQDRIFAEGEVGALRRLLSHVVISGALVGALALLASLGVLPPVWAILTAFVLYAHLLADLVWDVRRGSDPA